MKKVTPKQFKEFAEGALRGVRRREETERRQKMGYECVLKKLLECSLVTKRTIGSADGLRVIEAEHSRDSIVARIETANRVNTITIIPSTGGYHCSCMKKKSQKVCKDILAYLRRVLDKKADKRVAFKRLNGKTLKWLEKLIDKR